MKMISALTIVMIACTSIPNTEHTKFYIDIRDYDNSLAYFTHYKITSDSVVVIKVSSLNNDRDDTRVTRKILGTEKNLIFNFLSSFPIDNLKNEYKEELIDDGDQKRLEVVFGDKRKVINISNFYQEDIGRLIFTLNQILEKEVQIMYQK